jgi:ElaB/YqjD/DUF883 family membrane-anchored ribosome-binding protein
LWSGHIVGKKRAAKSKTSTSKSAGAFEDLGRRIDELPQVKAAEDALASARAELERAREQFRRIRQESVERAESLRQKNVGDLIDETLGYVRRHPGQCVAFSLLVGIFLGRITRR